MRPGLLALLLGACAGEVGAPPAELARVSDEVQYASVDRLGPHSFLTSITRSVQAPDEAARQTDEAVEIKWVDWTTFSYRRVVNGEAVMAVTTVQNIPYLTRPDGSAERRDDAEPYRIELRSGWNTWDQALERFASRITLTDQGPDVVEGRPARRYAVSLTPPAAALSPKQADRQARQTRERGEPRSLAGQVWIDAATAVKLVADVTGEWVRGDTVERVTLKMSASGIGQPIDLRAPEHATRAPLVPTESPNPPARGPAQKAPARPKRAP